MRGSAGIARSIRVWFFSHHVVERPLSKVNNSLCGFVWRMKCIPFVDFTTTNNSCSTPLQPSILLLACASCNSCIARSPVELLRVRSRSFSALKPRTACSSRFPIPTNAMSTSNSAASKSIRLNCVLTACFAVANSSDDIGPLCCCSGACSNVHRCDWACDCGCAMCCNCSSLMVTMRACGRSCPAAGVVVVAAVVVVIVVIIIVSVSENVLSHRTSGNCSLCCYNMFATVVVHERADAALSDNGAGGDPVPSSAVWLPRIL